MTDSLRENVAVSDAPPAHGTPAPVAGAGRVGSPGAALATAVLGFFVVTLDAVVVNVALPSIRDELGGGLTGLQWVVDGYTGAESRIARPAHEGARDPSSGSALPWSGSSRTR